MKLFLSGNIVCPACSQNSTLPGITVQVANLDAGAVDGIKCDENDLINIVDDNDKSVKDAKKIMIEIATIMIPLATIMIPLAIIRIQLAIIKIPNGDISGD